MARTLSIGVEKGPPIGMEKGPQTLVVRESLRELLGQRYSATILRDLLPAYLQRRR